MAKVNPSGTALVYSGFLGGWSLDGGLGIAVDSSGNAYVTGYTASHDFPAVVGPDTSYNGNRDAFVVKLSAGPPLGQGYIKGQVKDAPTNKAIQGATVEASGPTTSSTTTDPDGNYTMTLPPGTYTVTASATGYQPQSKAGVTVVKNQTTTINFSLPLLPTVTFERLPFDPTSTVTVMQGGVRYVYYLLKDAKGKPLANATVILNSGESITSTDSGEVGIPIRAGDKGVGTYPLDLVKEVRLGGQILSIKNPPRLTLQVLPREWERHWEFGAEASVSAGIEAYVKGQLGDGLDLGLEKEGAILVGRSSKVGVGGGVEIGPSFKLTGVLEAKAAASGEVMCLFTRDELYRFPEGTSNLEEKKALASLLVYLLASGANRFNPVVGAIL